jgi:hypothetical protein
VRVALTVLLTLSGCAEISGLDGLDVCDGSCVDVTTDAPQQPPDTGTSDASDGGTVDVAVKDIATSDVNDASGQPETSSGPCDKPSDCKNTDVCCETLVTKGTFFPQCTIDADTTVCTLATACPTTLGFQCSTDLLRRCTANTDCTESAAPKCCTLKLDGGFMRQVCMSSSTASLLGATCL